ncbi:MAG: helix-turn-helix domain-containing protein [Oscillospiraceae bacterium]|jgi:hypothetical protein|nr:helix-turn-helix domain-containing protein [Oscillospiraceae bacterium]
MAVFRAERNKGYTVMSNHHLRNRDLTLKSKGLLSQMLSLPEEWDFTLSGLAHINREKIDAIRTAVQELEAGGYIVRRQTRDDKGKMAANEYIIYEQPQAVPLLGYPSSKNPTAENPTQLNKEVSKTNLPKPDLLNMYGANTHSIPILSSNPLPNEGMAAEPSERKELEATDAYRVYEEIIKDNIKYDIIVQDKRVDREQLDEIVDLMIETVCTARKTIRVAGDNYPAGLVKAKFMKLYSTHIQFVFYCMRENTTDVRNIKKYMLVVLFNAPSTIGNYYSARVNHDLYGNGG